MRQDRFLLGILAGIGVLVVLAVGLFFLRRGTLEYGPDSTPDGVVRNYIVALKKNDYERAFSYMAKMDPPADYLTYQQSFYPQASEIASTGVEIGQVTITGNDALVQISLLQGNNGLFSESYRNEQVANLTLEGGSWKIQQMPYPFWNYAWVPTVKAQPAPANP